MPLTFSNLYPLSIRYSKSSTKVFGLQDTYIISFGSNLTTYSKATGCTPGLGGSNIIISGFCFRSFITFATSPAINSQLSNPFNFAFSLAALTASSINSTPITFLAFGATIWPIVPVPQ